MEHDFNVDADGNIIDTPVKTCSIKTAPDNVCQNVNGILDYNQATVDKWSCCSQEDFLTLYRMDHTNFCLAEAEAATTTTVTTTTTTTTTTTAATTEDSGLLGQITTFFNMNRYLVSSIFSAIISNLIQIIYSLF